MSDERRYDEAEVQEILERATAVEGPGAIEGSGAPALSPTSHGLTLSQLQEIGAEVGIPPERIADAAYAIGSRMPAPQPQTLLGAPRAVARIVPISRALDEDEWTRLVVDLRETFGAQGRIQVHGSLRSWSNGNLQVHVEPDGDRYRVRLQTLRGDAYPRAALGVVTLGTSGVMLLVNALSGLEPSSVAVAGVMALAGIGQLAYLRALLRRWAADRTAQMAALAERVRQLLGG
jgi:hypothetical protein